MNRLSRIAAVASLVGSMFAFAGCSKSSVPSPGSIQEARRHMNVVAALYGEYLTAHNNTPPATVEDFRKYLEAHPDTMKINGAESVDDVLKSKRDGQPFILVTGKRLAPADSPATPWAAYEQAGVDGKQMAAAFRGPVLELTPDEIAREFKKK